MKKTIGTFGLLLTSALPFIHPAAAAARDRDDCRVYSGYSGYRYDNHEARERSARWRWEQREREMRARFRNSSYGRYDRW
jgi:hypothetical protein